MVGAELAVFADRCAGVTGNADPVPVPDLRPRTPPARPCIHPVRATGGLQSVEPHTPSARGPAL